MNTPQPDTRTRLIHAARDLFWSGSYGSVSVDDICAKAAVRKGSFYHFFPGKANLALAVMEDDWTCARPHLEAITASGKPVSWQLRELIGGLVECQCEKQSESGHVQGLLCINIGHEMSSLNEDIRTKTGEYIDNYVGIFQKLLENAVAEGLLPTPRNLPALARAMFAAGMGVICHAKIQNDVGVMRTELPDVWSRFLAPAPEWSKIPQATQLNQRKTA
jgi:TetR/AcrR family transcriptional regulator, transcriptional repressor for nem operon